VAALEEKRAAAAGKCWVDVAFWGGAVPGNEASLRPLHEAGVVGFKCFLLDSGVPEFPPLDAAGLRTVLGTLAEVDALLIAHAEDAAEIKDIKPGAGRDFGAFVASRPPVAERRAIEKVISAAAATGARAHYRAPVRGRVRGHDLRREGGGHPADRRDLPALPVLRGRAGA
jgi:Dihydroorotase and related cyclic amidohydrolases